MAEYDIDAQDLVEAEVPSEEQFDEVEPKAKSRVKNNAADFFRPIRISADVAKATVGVDTDHITPELLLAASAKVLGVSQGTAKGDDRDSLEYQRVYGSSEYLPEHIQRDGGKVARNLLWKATNRGNIDFIGSGALEAHVDSVFNDSKLAQYIDGANMFEALDGNVKITRIGEGGVGDQRMAPKEMRNIHNSFMGYIDPVRHPECVTPNHQVLTSAGWKDIENVTKNDDVACLLGDSAEYRKPDRVISEYFEGDLYTYYSDTVSFEVTENHRMYASKSPVGPFHFVLIKDFYNIWKDEAYFKTNSGEVIRINCTKMSTTPYSGRVYCLTVPGGIFCTRMNNGTGFWTGNSLRIGLDAYLSKNTRKGSDGKLYTRMTNARTGEEEWVDSVTLARSKVATAEYSPGGKYGDDQYVPIPRSSNGIVSYVPRKEVDYYSMRPDEMFSLAANTSPFIGGIKEMRAMLACLHPDTELLVRRDGLSVVVPASEYEFVDGDMMVSFVDGVPGWRPVRDVLVLGTSEKMFTVTTRKGRSATVTEKHKWLVRVGKKMKRIPTNRLQPGMEIPYLADIDKAFTDEPGAARLDVVVDVSEDRHHPGYVIDIDMDDHCYMLANGLFTHNSKHFSSVVPLDKPEVPWVSTVDPDSMGPIEGKIGAMMGARKAEGPGRVKAVRKDRIEVEYDDGSKKSYELYNNYPNNQKGYIDSTPLVKAGDRVDKGKMLARTNFTNDKGEVAHGVNLRTVFMSWNGMNYEDAKVISESAAKKLSSTTMYKSGIDLDKSVKLGKANYLGWKPAEYSKEQMDKIEPSGVIKVGSVVHKGDPLFVGMRIVPPSPGSFGKKQFEDVSSTWEHSYPGVVTDAVQTRSGLKVFVKMSAPAQEGDKLSNSVGTKGVVAKVIEDEQMPRDEKGVPYDIIESPLSIISRCYSDDTEFMTEHGWRFGESVRSFDRLLCYDTKKNQVCWQYQDYPMHKRHYIGTMYGYRDKDTDFLVSEGHKVWGKLSGAFRKYHKGRIEEFYGRRCSLPRLAPSAFRGCDKPLYIDGKIIYRVYDLAALVAVYIRYGSLSSINGGAPCRVNLCRFGEHLPDAVLDLVEVSVRKLGYYLDKKETPFSVRINSKGLAKFLKSCEKYGKFRLPEWMFTQPREFVECFLEYLDTVFDGSVILDSKGLADDIQTLAVNSGIPVNIDHIGGGDWQVYLAPDGDTAKLERSKWYTKQYDGMIYCPTVPTGYVVTRRHGKIICMGNTNSAIIPILQLSEVAKKRGKPYYVENFPKEDINEFAIAESKKYNVPLTHTVTDPSTGRKIPDIQSGTLFVYKQKHMSEAKESARGTAGYTADDIPGRGGYTGCLTGDSLVYTSRGKVPISEIVRKKLSPLVLTWDRTKMKWVYNRVTDWFERTTPSSDVLTFSLEDRTFRLSATPNHQIYDNFGDKSLLGDLEVGDRVATYRVQVGNKHLIPSYRIRCIGPYVTKEKETSVFDITVENTHNYVANGILVSNSKRIGGMETAALASHNVFDVIKDAKLVRGQSNQDFWRSIRTGEVPVMPTEPLVYQKFYNHLRAAGVNVKRTPTGISVMSLTDKDAKELTGSRELNSADTFDSTTYAPIPGGLFGQDLFGEDGNQWAYIQLDEPLPNPVMEDPIRRILRLPVQTFHDILAGKEKLNGKTGGEAIKDALSNINVHRAMEDAKKDYVHASKSKKDEALKRYVALARMDKNGVNPSEYMLTRIPVLPVKFRPVMSSGGLTMVSDSNYLYKQMLEARDDLRNVKDLPEEVQGQARSNIYKAWKELTGMEDPSSPKLKQKSVKGLLRWALGTNPKASAFQSKMLSSTVDVVGRGVVVPDPNLKLDEIGIPKDAAFEMYSPFITRILVNMNYTPLEAMKQVKEQSPVAMEALKKAMESRPAIFNRAPTLHKLSMLGFKPKLTAGHVYRVNPSMVGVQALDFDGDTIQGLTRVGYDQEKMDKIFSYPDLTFSIDGVLYGKQPNNTRKEWAMIENVKMGVDNGAMRLQDLPVKPETEIKKSDTVTEWDVLPGFYTMTVDPATGKEVRAPITKVSRHTGLKMYDCILSICGDYNMTVTASEDHSLVTFNGLTMELEKTPPKESVGRMVPRVRWTTKNDRENCNRYIDMGGRVFLSYNLGVFLGTMIGDGWVDEQLVTRIACDNQSFRKYLLNLLSTPDNGIPVTAPAKEFVYNYGPGSRISDKDVYRITVYLEREARWCLQHLIGDGALNKHIPAECLGASKAHLIGILVGLLATDGTVRIGRPAGPKKTKSKQIKYDTISPMLRDGIQVLCSRLGINTTVTPYMGPNSKETCYLINLSVNDVARCFKDNQTYFRIPMDEKQKALEEIAADVEGSYKEGRYDVVPFPKALWDVCGIASKHSMAIQSAISAGRERGCITREYAREITKFMRYMGLDQYHRTYRADKWGIPKQTPEEVEKLVSKWEAIIADENIHWRQVKSVTPSTCTEGWDCTVPGPYTFSLWDGTVVQDTANVHIPVTDAAVREVYQKMLPQDNLLTVRKGTPAFPVEKEYRQGVYLASRMKGDKPVKVFDTRAEAILAYNNNEIDIDTPIDIRKK